MGKPSKSHRSIFAHDSIVHWRVPHTPQVYKSKLHDRRKSSLDLNENSQTIMSKTKGSQHISKNKKRKNKKKIQVLFENLRYLNDFTNSDSVELIDSNPNLQTPIGDNQDPIVLDDSHNQVPICAVHGSQAPIGAHQEPIKDSPLIKKAHRKRLRKDRRHRSSSSFSNGSTPLIFLDDSHNLHETIKKADEALRLSQDSTEPRNSQVFQAAINNSHVLKENRDIQIGSTSVKRKSPDNICNESKRLKNNTITIDDDDVLVTSPNTPKKNIKPINCSTPIATVSNFVNPDANITREINQSSFLTIDLTTETDKSAREQETVIDLANTAEDCTLVSVSNADLSISGESNVTVIERKKEKGSKRMRDFVKGICRLNSSEKGRLLEMITENIFNGCEVRSKISIARAPETAENTYIKEVILGEAKSRNSIGSNIYNPAKDAKNKTGLRMIVIDGSNVAMEHDKGRVFSVKALKICIDYFLRRGHVVKAFVPRFRCKFGMSSDPKLLDDLERQGLVVYTPSREIQGRRVCSYDDRYIIQCAAEFDGVIVSGDNYRDLIRENPRWRNVIETRVLPFTWVNDMIMFPRDPLGRNGPTLEQFLRHSEPVIQII